MRNNSRQRVTGMTRVGRPAADTETIMRRQAVNRSGRQICHAGLEEEKRLLLRGTVGGGKGSKERG